MGLYKYHSKGHELVKVAEGDKKAELFKAVGQVPIKNAPAVIVFSGMPERSKKLAFMYLEAGHAAQNVQLQAQSLKLGTVTMGGFTDEDVRKVLGMGQGELPIYLIPVGRR
jgi:SagB-type dehydrogenase family enzyme